ncbi:MAG: hypothetical protein NE328_02510 [Lentisphaeraceae bacterium]|nr:hypothetical protein [Lentisphaeraceae bacterium]
MNQWILFLSLIGLGFNINADDNLWNSGPVECYAVPAISSIKRLADTKAIDGRLSDELRLISAKGEYEPVSMLVRAREAVAKFELIPGELKGPGGIIPVENIDIKVVKVWYQGGTAWYSYFGDSNRRELTPELLLKDETLIKVDHKTKDNYLRINGKYEHISYTSKEDKEHFNYLTAKVADSKVLKPVVLIKNEYKQFWITIKTPEGANAGLYQGAIQLIADGKAVGSMKVSLKVLPYSLPDPKTYYNLENEFLVTIYGTDVLDMSKRLNIDQKTANELQSKIYENVRAHNIFNCRSDLKLAHSKDIESSVAALQNELRLLKKAGFKMKPLLSRGWAYPISKNEPFDEYKKRMDRLIDTIVGEIGHKDIYVTTWDEAGTNRVKIMRDYLEYVLSKGVKAWATTHKGRHFDLIGYGIAYANHGGWPKKEYSARWHAIGSKVASYAGPHTGPENPDVFRRMEGLERYKANYDGSFNYKLFTQMHPALYKKYKANVWNDFMGGSFRGFNIAYPTIDGLIDTLAWEGFREGIDDIRYATKLKQLAKQAMDSSNYKAGIAARKALMWLELLNTKTCDLNTSRLEIIKHIEKITNAMEK